MSIVPLEPSDWKALHDFACDADIARYGGHTPYDPPAVWQKLLTDVSNRVHRFGLWGGSRLTAFAELRTLDSVRAAHLAQLRVLAPSESDPSALIAHIVKFADDWMTVTKLEAVMDADHPHLAAWRGFGFEAEVIERNMRFRDGRLCDRVLVGRLRPGASFPEPGPPPPWPARGADTPGTLRIRPGSLPPEGGKELVEFMRQPSTMWGTLQIPSNTAARWDTRLATNDHIGRHHLVAEVDGIVVGSAGVFMAPPPFGHVGSIGMGIHPNWQGRGIGRALMGAVVDLGEQWLGAKRLDLEVWTDNTRAIGLYRSFGFEPEGVRRKNGMRAGGYADSLVMSRIPS
jgi:putative acetyltransferase